MVGSDDILTPHPTRDGALNRLKYVTTNDTKKQKNMVSLKMILNKHITSSGNTACKLGQLSHYTSLA